MKISEFLENFAKKKELSVEAKFKATKLLPRHLNSLGLLDYEVVAEAPKEGEVAKEVKFSFEDLAKLIEKQRYGMQRNNIDIIPAYAEAVYLSLHE